VSSERKLACLSIKEVDSQRLVGAVQTIYTPPEPCSVVVRIRLEVVGGEHQSVGLSQDGLAERHGAVDDLLVGEVSEGLLLLDLYLPMAQIQAARQRNDQQSANQS
jgi:hypothetical protein